MCTIRRAADLPGTAGAFGHQASNSSAFLYPWVSRQMLRIDTPGARIRIITAAVLVVTAASMKQP